MCIPPVDDETTAAIASMTSTRGVKPNNLVRCVGGRMRRWTFTFVALLLGGACSAPASAQSPEAIAEMMIVGDGPVLVIPMLTEFADLTAAQTDQVRQIFEAGRPRAQHLLNQLAHANYELAEALLAPDVIRARDADAIVKRLAQLRLELMQTELTTVRAIRKILTPMQFEKVTAAMEQMKKVESDERVLAERTF